MSKENERKTSASGFQMRTIDHDWVNRIVDYEKNLPKGRDFDKEKRDFVWALRPQGKRSYGDLYNYSWYIDLVWMERHEEPKLIDPYIASEYTKTNPVPVEIAVALALCLETFPRLRQSCLNARVLWKIIPSDENPSGLTEEEFSRKFGKKYGIKNFESDRSFRQRYLSYFFKKHASQYKYHRLGSVFGIVGESGFIGEIGEQGFLELLVGREWLK